MTRDDALERAIDAITRLMTICAEYSDMETAQVAADAQRKLVARRDYDREDSKQERGA